MLIPDDYIDQFGSAEDCPKLCCSTCKGSGIVVGRYEEDVDCHACNGTGWAAGEFPFALLEGE